MRRLLIALFFLFLAFGCISQPAVISDPYLKFRHLSVDDGLTNNRVLDILQDSKGFIWIATKQGLNKYDGYGFTQFVPGDSLIGLSNDHINCLANSTDGNLWVGTQSGLFKYFHKTNSFKHVSLETDTNFTEIHVRALYQDNGSILWIETASGKLIRYDWVKSEIHIISHDPPSMTDTYFYHSINPGRDNKLWLGGRYMGIMAYDTLSGEIVTIAADETNPLKKRDNDVAVYFKDHHGMQWIGGIDGLYSFEPENELFQKYLQISTFDILETKDNKLWIGTGSGVYILSADRKQFTALIHNENNPFSLTHNHVNKVFIDRSENVWIGTNNGISIYSPSANKFKHFYHVAENPLTPGSNHVSSIIEDKEGLIWVGTDNGGLDCFDQNFHRLHHYGFDENPPFELASDRVSTLMQDQDGDIWVGQWSGRGLNVVNPKSKTNKHFWFLPGEQRADWYNDILEDKDGNVWLGMWGAQGLYSFNKQKWQVNDQTFTFSPSSLNALCDLSWDGKYIFLASKYLNHLLYFDPESKRFIRHLNKNYYHYSFAGIYSLSRSKQGLIAKTGVGSYLVKSRPQISCKQISTEEYEKPTHNQPIDTLKDETLIYKIISTKNERWLATSKGLARISASGVSQFFTLKPAIPDTIISIDFGESGILWGITKNALIQFDTLTMQMIGYDGSEGKYISSRLTSCLFEDSKGRLWIGNTEGSLDCMNRKTGTVVSYDGAAGSSSSFRAQEVSFVTEDAEGNIWIGGEGIYKLDTTGQFTHIGTADGLPSNDVMACLFDDNNQLWISSKKGLSCYDRNTGNIRNYTIADGLQDNEFSKAALKLSDGRMVFGGKNGLTVFHPDQLFHNGQTPDVELTGFYLFEEKQNFQHQGNEGISLKYDQNYFSFEFTALDFSNPAQNTFQYKLESFDNKWINLDASSRRARYTNVNPGSYVFKVRAANNDGVLNEMGTSIQISISPPFWQTWWFYSLLILIFTSLIYIWIKQRERKIKEMNRVLVLEQKLLRSQMNPHFIFNSLSSIQSFIFESNPMAAGSYLSRFAELIRSILYNSREEFIPLAKEIAMLRNYLDLQQLRYQNKFEYELDIEQDLEDADIMIPPMLAQPFIENAIEHGIKNLPYKGVIKLILKSATSALLIIVEDNGIGIEATKKLKDEKAKKHKSLATKITRERIEVLNRGKKNSPYKMAIEDIKNKNGNIAGTRVTFVLLIDNF